MNKKSSEKTIDPRHGGASKTEDVLLEITLRPTRWDEYIGQKHIKDNVKILLKAAQERGHIPEHILFIDEIHRLNKMVEEILYPAMESGVLDIIIGKGPSARTIQLDLPPFTL